MIKTAKRLDAIQEYYFSQKLRQIAQMNAEGKQVLNLGIGSPDLAPHPAVIKALHETANQSTAHSYQSYNGIPALRQALANWYQNYYQVQLKPENEILPLIGSKEGIVHIAMTFLEAGDQALVPNPGYPAYSAATQLAGATPIFYDLLENNYWQPDWEQLATLNLEKVKIMWLNYPNMPTGAVANKILFEKAVTFAKKHNILLVNDNPYSFILNDSPLSIFSVADAKAVALELNSLSKSHNMAGWRVGMVGGNAHYLQEILRFKSNMDSGIFLGIQHAAIEALRLPQSWFDGINAIYRERQKLVFELLKSINCQFDTNQRGMFVWAKIPKQFKNGYELSDILLNNANVFLTPGGIFGSNGEQYIRVSLCSKNEILKEAIKRCENIFQNNTIKK